MPLTFTNRLAGNAHSQVGVKPLEPFRFGIAADNSAPMYGPVAAIAAFESWLGGKISIAAGDAVSATVGNFSTVPYPLVGHVAFYLGDGNGVGANTSWEQTAAGAMDSVWAADMAALITARDDKDAHFILRVQPEFNDDWPPTSTALARVGAPTFQANFITSFQRFVNIARGLSPKFLFGWGPNWNTLDPTPYYPGDAYVDIIGMDLYNTSTDYRSADPLDSWNWKLETTNPTNEVGISSLRWLTEFAEAHGKRICIEEWGVDTDNFGLYFNLLYIWMKAHNVLYHTYSDYHDAPGSHEDIISDNSKPANATAFKNIYALGKVPTLGPNLLINGSFDTDTSGWTLTNATFVSTGGKGVLTTTTGAVALAKQTLTVVVGKTYELKGTLYKGDATPVYIAAFTVKADDSTEYAQGRLQNNLTTAQTRVQYFTALETTVIIYLEVHIASAGHAAYFDDLSVRLVDIPA